MPPVWGTMRVGLLAVLGVVLIGAALTAVRPASMDELRDALRAGEVTQVHMRAELTAPAGGELSITSQDFNTGGHGY